VPQSLLNALYATGFTFICTALGAALVFFLKGEVNQGFRRGFLGFAGGVMTAAAVWSLIMPAVEMSEAEGKNALLPAAGGFFIGTLFLLALDLVIPHMHLLEDKAEGLPSKNKKSTLLVFAVTLHNIPEGLAVGMAFGSAAATGGEAAMLAAATLALGMGLQNIPEGAAISLPLREGGMSKTKSFLLGSLSGAVEPVAGVIGALLTASLPGIMPWFLTFAAGAMIYVVVEELIPEASSGGHSNVGTLGFIGGFVLMMLLDLGLS
jgi:ZIP family zinc transporter